MNTRRRITSPMSLAIVLVATVSCGVPCDRLAQAAVTLEVVDADTGAPLLSASVSYTVDDEAEATAEYVNDGFYGLGGETTGRFHVTVQADGYESAERDYVVRASADGCGVDAVTERVELAPA